MLVEGRILDSDPVLEALPARQALLRIVYLFIGLGLDITPAETHVERNSNPISTSLRSEKVECLKLKSKSSVNHSTRLAISATQIGH